ncbi:MAG: hypothetical protein P1V97_07975 [Planctomycetota bacterium]|nr:hypothetical protein [Planctomycetota bacterium]
MSGKMEAFDRVLGEESEMEYECFNCRSIKPPTLTFMSRVGPPIFGILTIVAPIVYSFFAEDFIDPLILGVFFFILCGRSIKNREKGCADCGSVLVAGARREGMPGTRAMPTAQGRRFAPDFF